MRGSYDDLVEIVDAFQEDEQFFGLVRLQRNAVVRTFRFGVSQKGYFSLKRALQTRPFAHMPGTPWRCFFTGALRREGEDVYMTLRIEQGNEAVGIEVLASEDLLQNLVWFIQLANWDDAGYLLISDQE